MLRTLASGSALLAAACTTVPRTVAPVSPAEVGEVRPGTGLLNGFLAANDLPDSLALLPPPPAEGTPAFAARRRYLSGADTASRDATRRPGSA